MGLEGANKNQFNQIERRTGRRVLSIQREFVIRALSFLFIGLIFVMGAVSNNSAGALTIVIVAGSYQLFRLYFYFFGSLSWFRQELELPALPPNSELPFVSILVPCFNEEKVIAQSLRSLARLNYPAYEIIVIDDGSSDHTVAIVNALTQIIPIPITVLTKENSGKAHSLNLGLLQARGDLVLCVDADCLMEKNALRSGVRHLLANEDVVAVAGAVHVENSRHLITAYQELEYGLGDLQKAALANYGRVNIIPGPVGLFRRDVLLRVGGYEVSDTTFAEDTELTLRLIAAKGKITFDPAMSSSTEAPDNWHSLVRQRYRWTRGIYQALRKNVDGLVETKNKTFVTYLFMEKVWTPIMDFGLLTFFVAQFVMHARLDLLMRYNLAIILSEAALVFLTGWYSRRPVFQNIVMLIFSRFTFSIVIATWKYLCLLEEWNHVSMSWDKLSRQGIQEPERGEVVC